MPFYLMGRLVPELSRSTVQKGQQSYNFAMFIRQIKQVVKSTTAGEAFALVLGLKKKSAYSRALICNILQVRHVNLPITAIIDYNTYIQIFIREN